MKIKQIKILKTDNRIEARNATEMLNVSTKKTGMALFNDP
jgi:hypothetical protein